MNTGDFDREITVYKGTPGVSSGGIVENAYTDPQTLFAEVTELSGTERFKSQTAQDLSQRIARFTFWFFRKIEFTDRIVYDSENWDIINVRTIGRNEYTEITAQVVK